MIRNDISISRQKDIKNKPWLVRWWGEYDPATGKQRRYGKSFSRKKDAERFVDEKLAEFECGMPKDKQDITLEELCDKFLKARKHEYRHSTIRAYKETIAELKKHFYPAISIKSIRVEDAQGFVGGLELVSPVHINKGKQLADSSRNRRLREARSIFNSAVEWGYLRVSPFRKVKEVKPKKDEWHYISPVEFQAIRHKTSNLKAKALYHVCYYCGLRSGEALNLLWDGLNVDFHSGRINITGRRGGPELPLFSIKDYEVRSIPMPKKVIGIMINLQEEAEEGCPFVFLTRNRYEAVKARWNKMRQSGREKEWENRMLLPNVLRNFQRRCIAAGIRTNEKVTLHCLRKSWACNLAGHGTPIQTLMKLGGWSSPRTCQQYYLKSSDENEKKAVEILDQLAVEQEAEIRSVQSDSVSE